MRNVAREAGRNPKSVKIYAIVVTAPDTLTPAERSNVLEARAVSYFMHRDLGLPIVTMNGWEEGPMDRLAASGVNLLDYGTSASVEEKRRRMAEAVAMLPPEWLTSGAAIGSVDHCIGRLREYIAAGADEILLHGTTPKQQAALITEARNRVL